MQTWKPIVEGRPRIHLTAADVPRLKEKARGSHALYYRKLIEAADACAEVTVPRVMGTGDDHRGFGGQMTTLAMAFLLTEDKKYLDRLRRFLRPTVKAESWQEGIGLVTGHLMSGVACAYDWLADYLEPGELDEMADAMIRNARLTYKKASEQRVWWHDNFLQNWCQVPTATLAYAAAALFEKTDEAADWIAHCDFVYSMAHEALAGDGSCEEGQSYMTYSWEWFLRYFDIARAVFGRDHWDCDWLRNAPYMMLHCTLPDPEYHNSAMIFGDGRRHCEWNGPVHLLQRCAAEYRDEVIQGFASWLASRGVGVAPGSAWMNMLWYDSDLPAGRWRDQPLSRCFWELSTAWARSGWDEDATLVGFKCTHNITDEVREAFPGRPIGGGHCHPDAASFQVYAFGEWLAVDPGYTVFKLTENHNTLIINGTGQLGGDEQWFDMRKVLFNADARFTHFEDAGEFVYARADASKIYKPKARLARFIRHLVYLRPHDFLIVDELETEIKSRFDWVVHAEESITGEDRTFFLSKGDAGARVVILAPEDFTAKIRRQKVAIPRGNEHEAVSEMDGLWIRPAQESRSAFFAVLMNFYKGEAPGGEPGTMVKTDDGLRLSIRRPDGMISLSMRFDEGKVSLARM